jgi:hypothetical protein
MVKTLRESLPTEELPGLYHMGSSKKMIKTDSRKPLKIEANNKIIADMRMSNQRSASLANIYTNRSQAMISNGESVILAERLSKLNNETISPRSPNIFELTSPRNEGPSIISNTSASFFPSLGLRASGGMRSKKDILNDFQKKSPLQKNITDDLVKDAEITKRRRSVLLNNNKDAITDIPDLRMGKKHRKIKIESNYQQPLYKFDQTALDAEREQFQSTVAVPKGISAYSRLFDQATQEYKWEECTLLAKVAPGKYAIKWSASSKPKVVDRLNLKYPEEMELEKNNSFSDERLKNAKILQYESLYNLSLNGRLLFNKILSLTLI